MIDAVHAGYFAGPVVAGISSLFTPLLRKEGVQLTLMKCLISHLLFDKIKCGTEKITFFRILMRIQMKVT